MDKILKSRISTYGLLATQLSFMAYIL